MDCGARRLPSFAKPPEAAMVLKGASIQGKRNNQLKYLNPINLQR
jgi:hypothetical protein